MQNVGDWYGCYKLGWKGIITPKAFSHPAKFSHGLIRRIYQHAFKEGWLKEGDVILDPFGGVALGALYAMKAGCCWIGIELESKFVELGWQNIDLWREIYGPHFKPWGAAALIQGDSRHLAKILTGANVVVSSPPYAESIRGQSDKRTREQREKISGIKLGGGQINYSRNYGSTPGQLASLPEGNPQAIIGSPPYADGCAHQGGDDPNPEHIQGGKRGAYGVAIVASPPFADSVGSDNPDKRGGLYRDPKRRNDRNLSGSYGDSDGQLGAMKEGDPQAIIASPPFAGNTGGRGEASRQGIDAALFDRHSGGMKRGTGEDPANLDHLPQGRVEAVIGSPPYADGIVQRSDRPNTENTKRMNDLGRPGNGKAIGNITYGSTPGQLGTDSGDTFWSAAAVIVQQCYQILPIGGHAIWVTKRYVKNGQIVDFSDNWRRLCEAVGFKTVCIHRAWLVDDKGAQLTMDGGQVEYRTEKKSFFRRLAEKNGSPRIDWEDVICMVK